jgi:hypothetical protein
MYSPLFLSLALSFGYDGVGVFLGDFVLFLLEEGVLVMVLYT